MRVSGHFDYAADPLEVYSIFTDPEALLMAAPGLTSLTEVAPDRWEAVVKVGIGGFALVYTGTLAVTNRVPGEAYHLLIDVVSHNGYAKGEADFRFLPLPGGRTRTEYEGEVELGGAQKLLPAVAKYIVEFFMRGMAETLAHRKEAPACNARPTP